MSLAVFENFLKFAESAIAAKAALPPAIDAAEFESALVNYGLVLLHSHMEQCIKGAIEARCVRCGDKELRTFALSIKDKETGQIGIESLMKTLARFGKAYKDAFVDGLNKPGRGPWKDSAWESVKNQRATVAHHGQPATCSLADLRLFYDDIRNVIGLFCSALGLTAAEVTGISSLIVMVPSRVGAPSPALPP